MSKSLGNSPDQVDLIEEYGADTGVGLLLMLLRDLIFYFLMIN